MNIKALARVRNFFKASADRISMGDGMAYNSKNELVDFIVHRVFYPVLMADRGGPNKAIVEHVQNATRAEIDRLRSYDSIEEVVESFNRYLRSKSAQAIYAQLKLLHLPVISDLRDDFEQKARELGFEPSTVLTSFSHANS